MRPDPVDDPRDPIVRLVVLAQVPGQKQQHFPPYDLVSVHVAHVLELGLLGVVLARTIGYLQDVQLPALDRLPHGVEPRYVGVVLRQVLQVRLHRRVVVVGEVRAYVEAVYVTGFQVFDECFFFFIGFFFVLTDKKKFVCFLGVSS